ncbi:acyltransferase family protein [Sphingomonas colocasiae]|uniref:Acyltransferase n=1 Tax=Sphingomonas colocasiae TaxID=1848973 RepID=A0ABS7PRK0_9SPHN|nr:acyltransferase [Sphingomonas colocasiae]MBY8823609.1 acyltransferase [Sphingomonas colocasiae]
MASAGQDRTVSDSRERKTVGIPTASIDFLRGIAAIYVVINHARGNLFVGGEAILAGGDATLLDKIAIALLQATALGTEFVVLFFVLSGFAMAHSVSHTRSRAGFYLKRMIRVWPAYLAALAFAVVVCVVVTKLGTQYKFGQGCAEKLCEVGNVLRIAFYLDVKTSLTPQFWSLPYEIAFYAMDPFILSSQRLVIFVFIASCFGMMLSMIFFGLKFNPAGFWENFFLQEIFLFAVGAMAYRFFEKIPIVGGVKLISIMTLSFLSALLIKKIYGETNLIGNIIFSIATVILIRNLPNGFGESKLNFGYFSYSIYIYHVAILGLFLALLQVAGWDGAMLTSYWGWLLALPPTIGFCWILWWCSERPCIAVLDRIRQRQRVNVEATS